MAFLRVHVNEKGFTGLDITIQGESQCINGNRFTRHAKVRFGGWIELVGTRSNDHGTNTMGITESNQTNAIDEVHASVTTLDLGHDGVNGSENGFHHLVVLLSVSLGLNQGFGENVKQEFRIGISVHVAIDLIANNLGQFLRIGQITIVRHTDSVRIIRVQRLRFGTTGTTCRGVSHVSDTHVAAQFQHVVCLKDILDQSIVLAQMEATGFGRHHACSVLTAVLQYREAIKEHLIDKLILVREEDTDDAAHDQLIDCC
mmetsp:Transcript_28238/g.46768  ORF Transcript_28238/g.46768 Transcript_28238/m.46768 type:complete len:258 (-) Transcript_28238:96-869(-)